MISKTYTFFLSTVFFTQFSAQTDSSRKAITDICLNPSTYNVINTNNIATNFHSGGEMHRNFYSAWPVYEFPKGSGKNAAGVSALWIAGLDGGGQLKVAAMTYRQNGIDFWAGPLDLNDASIDFLGCSFFDVAPSVKTSDIETFRQVYKSGLSNSANYPLDLNIKTWSANRWENSATTDTLAPYVDVDSNGVYDPLLGGDYPKITGSQMMHFIHNDKGGIHRESNGIPLGIEVHHSIYAYGCPEVLSQYPELNNVIFHKYRIYNRSAFTVTQTAIGMWSSSCIGDERDDFVGSNPKKGYAYYYNGDSFDNVYDSILPATAVVLLKAPLADNNDLIDNNGNGQVDEPQEEMSQPNVFYYKETLPKSSISPFPEQSEPNIASHYYGYLTGFWKDGSPFTCGGDAFQGSINTKHVFPEEVVPGSACNYTWTEKSEGNTPGKRSLLVCTQAFTFKAKSFVDIDFAFVSAIDSTQPNNNWASVAKLKQEVSKVKNFYQLTNKPVCMLRELEPIKTTSPFNFSIYPNPSANGFSIKSGDKITAYELTNALGQSLMNKSITPTHELYLDLAAHPAGTYILKLIKESGSSVHKLVKTK